MKKQNKSVVVLLTSAMTMNIFAAGFSSLANAKPELKSKDKSAVSSPQEPEELQTVTTVVADLIPFENGFIIRRPMNEGKALKIQDAMAFTEAKLRYLQAANASKNPIQVVVKGTQIVDILTH